MRDPHTTELIEGFKLDVPGLQMKEHMIVRSKYHFERMEAYKVQMANLLELQKTADENSQGISKGSGHRDPIESLKISAKDHEKKYRFFTLGATFIIEGAVYRLSWQDMQQSEMAPGGY